MSTPVNAKPTDERDRAPLRNCDPQHPAWRAFMRYCAELKHGEIERLVIQDGLPVLAELTKQKVKFS
jgi:hypothetical protein